MSLSATQERRAPTRGLLHLFRLLLLLVVLGFATLASAKAPANVRSTFTGEVVGVIDGDSLHIRRANGTVAEIRMAGIDAPEYSQPWGAQATRAMKALVLGKPVRVEVTDKDMYGRLVAKIWQGNTYVNAAMTRSGNAWAFDRYMKDSRIRAGQTAARSAKRGLWSQPERDQLPPATWRARHPR